VKKNIETINFITTYFVPEIIASSERSLYFVLELEKQYTVNVFCLTEMGKYQDDKTIQFSKNTTIYYINQEMFNRRSFFTRAFHEIKYSFKLVEASKKVKSDITYVASPYMFLIPIVAYRLSGKKMIDNRDLLWEYLKENNFLQKIIKYSLKRVMKRSLHKFDEVIVTNREESKFLKEQYALRQITIIPNGISQEKYNKLIKISIANNTQWTIVYIGNVALGHNLEIFLEVSKQYLDIQFLIIGEGSGQLSLKAYATKHRLSNVVFKNKMKWKELLPYYQNASILYAQLDGKEYEMAMPSKLYEYASLGLPIIYGGVGYANSFVKNLETAHAISPNSIEELVLAIESIKNSEALISYKNRLFIKKYFIRENISKKLTLLIEKRGNFY